MPARCQPERVRKLDHHGNRACFICCQSFEVGQEGAGGLDQVAGTSFQFGTVIGHGSAPVDRGPVDPTWARPLMKCPERLNRALYRSTRQITHAVR